MMRRNAAVALGMACALSMGACLPRVALGQARATATWKLRKGSEPVCAAYAQMLNATRFADFPYCDRKPERVAAGFVYPGRVPVAPEQLARLADPVISFLDTGVVSAGTANAEWLAGKQREGLASVDPLHFFYRFAPAPDLDNDGTPDDLLVWNDVNARCGAGNYANGAPMYTPVYLLVLTPDGSFDADRTRELFGHPRGNTLVFQDPRDAPKKKVVREKRGFRAIGTSFGLFQYQGLTYFDTFYAPGGDLENARDSEPGYLETLAVLRRRGGRTQLVCELRVSDVHELAGDAAR